MVYTTSAAYLLIHPEHTGYLSADAFTAILSHFSAIVNNYLGVSSDEAVTGDGAIIVPIIHDLITQHIELCKIKQRVDPMEALQFGTVGLNSTQKLQLDRMYTNTTNKPVAFNFNIDTGDRITF